MNFIKDVPEAEVFNFRDLIDYRENGTADMHFVDRSDVRLFLLALRQGERIPEHTPPGDALLTILEGRVRIQLREQRPEIPSGRNILLPATAKRSLEALEDSKALFVLVLPQAESGSEETDGCSICGSRAREETR